MISFDTHVHRPRCEVSDTYFAHKMSTIHTISPVTSAVAVAYIEASSEDMIVAFAEDTCLAMTVITDCADKVEDGVANANPYEDEDDGADGGTRGSEGESGGADGGGDGCEGADGDTSRAVSVLLASTPRPPRESRLGAQELGNKNRYRTMHTNVTANTMTITLLVPISVKALSTRKN